MTIIDRLLLSIKAATRMVFPRYGRTYRATDYGLRYGTRHDLDGGRGNSIVVACVLWMARTFPEAPVRVRTVRRDGTLEDAPNHPLALLLARPNPYYSGSLLWWATLTDWLFGNAYWLKVRSAGNRVVQYWWLPAHQVEPMWDPAGTAFIDYYAYRPDGYEEIRYDPADVVHFRYGLDPLNPRKGLSPLGVLLRELYTDAEAAAYVASMLSNLGVPGVVISPSGDNTLQQGQAEEIKRGFSARFGGDRRGEPLVLDGATTVAAFGFSPEQMTVRELRRIPEERVTAVLGIPAVVVGLGAGLDRSTFANFKEAREAAVESCLVPSWRLMAEEMQSQLLPDFDAATAPRLTVDFDLSKVRVLQEDVDALHVRAREDVLAGLVTLDEGRQMIGKDALDGDAGRVLFVPSGVTPTEPSELLATPEVAPGASEGPLAALPEAAGVEGADRKAAVERVGPLDYVPDPLPPMIYDAAERKRLASAWRTVMADTPYENILDAEPMATTNGTH